ncbi:MAG: DEAD/DEAH box helicase family protein [Syntrophobacteraceae bacterium]
MAFTNRIRIENNTRLRIPQRDGWIRLRDYFRQAQPAREVGIVLPVGCGKSGLISITPFAVEAQRVLVIAPGTRIRKQLADTLRVSSERNFYEGCAVISPDQEFPELAVIESGRINLDDLQNCDIAVTNIQQISGEENRWLDQLPPDFFDLILVDEGHHNPAASWQKVKQRFPSALIINFSATPARADGRLMEGEIIYSFPVIRAIEAGYVKRLRAKMLRPTELRYIDNSSGQERIIGPDEVRQLGETDAEFRRGIVMSDETLSSIVDCSIGELRRLRRETGEQRLKIIASALNYDHCIQITEAFRARGLRAGYVHSREGEANERVFTLLENHELDVIVQARMLGEGFDHRYLAVAMVGNIYSNLSPFVQFVGRVMRAIVQDAPGHPLNQGVVVFHVGANVARRWDDFRNFSEADQEYFADLLPEAEEVDFGDFDILDRTPGGGSGGLEPVEVVEQMGVRATDMQPIGDPQAARLLQELADMGVTPDQAAEEIRRIRGTRQEVREARRSALYERAQNEAGGILNRLGMSPGGKTLDPSRRQRNYVWVVAQLNRRVNERMGGGGGQRQELTMEQLEIGSEALPEIVRLFEQELRDAKA